MKKVFIKNYGCQMNIYDTNKVLEILSSEYIETPHVQEADLVILNTCHVREKAVLKLYSDLGRINKIKEKRETQMLIAVIGCVAQIQGDSLSKHFPYVNFILGTQAIQELPKLIQEYYEKNSPKNSQNNPSNKPQEKEFINFSNTLTLTNEKFDSFKKLLDENLISQNSQKVSAFLTIQEGCDNFCTYCSVPLSRGREYSRNFHDIIDEAKFLVKNGVKEIILLGQNVNSYHFKNDSANFRLEDILYEISELQDLKRILYISPNPQNMTDKLIEAHKNIEKLIPFLHLPLQSGSNKILKQMNRPYTNDEYLDIIHKLKSARPNIEFSTDLIVGFPGETDEDFADTLQMVEKVNFISSFYFKYSKRPSTIAASMPNQIPESVKDERFQILHKILQTKRHEYNKNSIGKIENVLFESQGKFENHFTGKTEHFQNVFVKNADQNILGTVQKVKILSSNQTTLEGEIIF